MTACNKKWVGLGRARASITQCQRVLKMYVEMTVPKQLREQL